MVCAMPPKRNTQGQRSVPGGGSTVRQVSVDESVVAVEAELDRSVRHDGRTSTASAIAVARMHAVDAVRQGARWWASAWLGTNPETIEHRNTQQNIQCAYCVSKRAASLHGRGHFVHVTSVLFLPPVICDRQCTCHRRTWSSPSRPSSRPFADTEPCRVCSTKAAPRQTKQTNTTTQECLRSVVFAMPPKSNTRRQRSVPGGGSTIGR